MSYPTPATPLPWSIVVETRDYRPDIAACHIWTAKGPGYGMVATTAPWCQPYDRERKDAAYILAAANAFPHLVAALDEARKEVESAMPDWCDEHEQEPCCCSWHDTLKTIYAALAIARGEVTP